MGDGEWGGWTAGGGLQLLTGLFGSSVRIRNGVVYPDKPRGPKSHLTKYIRPTPPI